MWHNKRPQIYIRVFPMRKGFWHFYVEMYFMTKKCTGVK